MRTLISTSMATLLVCAISCGPRDLGSEALWTEPDITRAIDMGHTPRTLPLDERVPPGPITLVDVTDAAGLSQALGGGNPHGVGIGFLDIDGDEWPDIYIANGHGVSIAREYPSQLFLNQGDGTFRDVTQESGLAEILAGRDTYSVAAGDYDGDRDTDLYIGAQPTDILLSNCSQPGLPCFEDATERANAGGPPSDPELVRNGRSKIAAFGDFDSDGDLDILSASTTLPPPGVYLLQNNGDSTFTDISAQAGVAIAETGNPCAVMWSDYDNDADPDVWIWNDRGGHILLRNQRGQHFEDVTVDARLHLIPEGNPMGIDAADIDHDGDLDYYVSNSGQNPLLRNNGDGTFLDISGPANTGGDFGWGLGFEDLDHDTFADIFVAQEDDLPYLVFHNLGRRPAVFARIDLPHAPVLDRVAAHNVAVAFADYDRDGRVDVVTATSDGSRINLFQNQTDIGTQHYLHVIVRPEDGPENWTGVGARVAVKTGDLIQFRDIKGGSSRASQNQLSVRFGLGHTTGADLVIALWPSGRQTVLTNVPGDQTVIIP